MNSIFAICLFLTFRFVDGNECSFPADGLSISVENQTLQVKSSELSAALPISNLASMSFTNSGEVRIENVESGAAMEVFSLKGESLGSFKSIPDLRKSLPGATYIVRQGKNTIKISI